MNSLLKEQPMSDHTAGLIKKNTLAARDALTLIAKRHRKLEPEKCFEAVANTIGILAAELVRDGYSVAGDDLAVAMRDLVLFHMDHSLSAYIKEE